MHFLVIGFPAARCVLGLCLRQGNTARMAISMLEWLLVSALAACMVLLLLKSTAQPYPATLPCLPSLPIVGSLLSLKTSLPLHLQFTSLREKYGELFALYVGPHYTVVINSFTLAKEVLLHNGKAFAGRPHMMTTDLLSRGGKDIAFADYSPLWKAHRRLVHSSFVASGEGSSKLQGIVCEEASILCSILSAKAGEPLDPGPVLTRAVTNVVCTLVFSSKYHPEDAEFNTVMEYNNGIVHTIARGNLVDIFPWLKIFPNRDLKQLKECIQVRDKLLTNKLEEHKKSYSPDDTRDLMDVLLKGRNGPGAESGITDDHVLMTAAEAFGAGVETTSTTLLWALAFLIHYPEVQKKIHQEIDEKIGHDRTPNLSDRGQLPYLESTLSEVLRIRPVAPLLIPHVALQDTSIGEHFIPKDTRVVVNMWSIHHDPRQWDEPERFRPERFLDSQGQRSSPASFIPFGAGPRVCVGESLAKMELFLFSSWLLQRFSVSGPPGAGLPDLGGRYGVVLQPQPYSVVITPRQGRAK
ncbi:cytochrome P450 17A2 [Lepisosteus oculatus]|uniref:cytochrome P450 17A2 n=1 Tax=Lepisosteus oculatus TaxID=7918 RepID=UPI0035F50237